MQTNLWASHIYRVFIAKFEPAPANSYLFKVKYNSSVDVDQVMLAVVFVLANRKIPTLQSSLKNV